MKILYKSKFLIVVIILSVIFLASFVDQVFAQQTVPKISLSVDKANGPGDVAVTLEILLLMTVLTLAPAILILTTSFTRIIVIFHFMRQAAGLQQMPPNQVLIGLALFLTLFVMNPVFDTTYTDAIKPYMNEELSFEEASKKAIAPLRTFMLKQTREKDLSLLVSVAKIDKPQNETEIPTHILIPAFVISELRIAFQIGFLIYIPFLVIDVIVASVLMSMGMLMLPPVMISLPFKILLFVLIDGWYLIVGSVIRSFNL
jgi:flagellar biosynthesis protein FliP